MQKQIWSNRLSSFEGLLDYLIGGIFFKGLELSGLVVKECHLVGLEFGAVEEAGEPHQVRTRILVCLQDEVVPSVEIRGFVT